MVGLLLAGCGRQDDQAQQQANRSRAASAKAAAAGNQAGVTPMNERVAVLGLLNKRNSIVRDLRLKPGQSVRAGDVIVRLRACESSAPWESEKLTGAFVQVDVQRPDNQWQRVFSGWLYKESPSLNVVEHPVYDVWPKSCAMTYPSASGEPEAPAAARSRSSARNSGGDDRAAPAPAPRPAPAEEPPGEEPAAAPPSASDSNLT
jgi:hypothetical protein